MVQNRVTMARGAFRQVRRLAEGQKARTSKRISRYHPLRPPRQLAEGVEFPERYADFSPLGPSFGGRGSNLREKCKSLAASPIIRRSGRLAGLLPDSSCFEPRLKCP